MPERDKRRAERESSRFAARFPGLSLSFLRGFRPLSSHARHVARHFAFRQPKRQRHILSVRFSQPVERMEKKKEKPRVPRKE